MKIDQDLLNEALESGDSDIDRAKNFSNTAIRRLLSLNKRNPLHLQKVEIRQYLSIVRVLFKKIGIDGGLIFNINKQVSVIDAVAIIKDSLTQADSIFREHDNSIWTANLDDLEEEYSVLLNNKFCYEFTDGDLDRIQTLINELRELISNSELFETDHQRRLLKRLEKLQSEMHKQMSNLDVFWGLVGEAGVVMGKFGNDAKPFVDRIREIANAVWRTQTVAEELSTDSEPFVLTDASGEQ